MSQAPRLISNPHSFMDLFYSADGILKPEEIMVKNESGSLQTNLVFSKGHSVARNDPWLVERRRSSWRTTPETGVFAHRSKLPGPRVLV